jgi:sugar phosphate isomerase/epimerase
MSSLPESVPTIALAVQPKDFPRRFLRAQESAFALEYTPDPQRLDLISPQIKPFTAAGVPVRFHCRFFDHEIGHADPVKAKEATQVHLRVIEAIAGLGEPVVTVHLNLIPTTPFDARTGLENLTRLAAHGREHGITVCLENLRRGPSCDPANVSAWAEKSGAMITLDVGHAVSCEPVKSGRLDAPDFVDLFRERLYEAHIYGKEEDRHYPIEDMTVIGPIVDRLLATECKWWTIELEDFGEALGTRAKLLDYLKFNRKA